VDAALFDIRQCPGNLSDHVEAHGRVSHEIACPCPSNARLQPRWLMILPAADSCKPMLAVTCVGLQHSEQFIRETYEFDHRAWTRREINIMHGAIAKRTEVVVHVDVL
jgi:hypothetical protein